MLKSDFFKTAMLAGMGKRFDWCVRAFSIVNEEENAWKKQAYVGMIVQHHTGHYVVNEQNELVKLEDAVPGQPPYKFEEHLMLKAGDAPNVHAEFETSYGNFLFNWIVLVYAFDGKIPYQTGNVKTGKIEEIMLQNFQDDPKDDSLKEDGVIYVSEYLRYSEALDYLRSFTQLCVWAATKKTLLPPPGIQEYKEKLLKENEGHLDDLVTIAKIDAALVEYDAQWLKGDPGEKFLGEGAARTIKRKKKFLMHGAETGMEENAVKGTLISNSLYQGWDLTKFDVMNNSSRSGSFNRGAQTQLGGVSVKWLLRASANLVIASEDCGSKMGSPFLVDNSEVFKMQGMTVIEDDGTQVKIKSAEQGGAYLGKVVRVRNPMYCQLGHTDYCKTCLGDKLSISPTGLSVAISEMGSTLLLIFMKSMHGKQLATQKMDLSQSMS